MTDGTTVGTRQGRVARAVAASSVATFAALVAHVLAGGSPPPLFAVLCVLVLSWLPAVVLVGRRNSRVGVAAIVGLSEFAFHGVFSWLAAPSSAAMVPHTTSMPGMPGMAGDGAGSMLMSTTMGATDPGVMWAGHAVAAFVTLLCWLRGEAAVRAIARAADDLFVALLRVVVSPVDVEQHRDRVERAERRPVSALLNHSALRRGPPLLFREV